MGRYQQTAHNSNLVSESVTITNPIHPLFGRSVKVHQLRRWGQSVRVIIVHPEGGLLSISAAETSLELRAAYPIIRGQTPLFDPRKLLRLIKWSEQLEAEKSQKTDDHKQDQSCGNQKTDDETRQHQSNSPLARRQTQETPDSADRQISQQNSGATNTTTSLPDKS